MQSAIAGGPQLLRNGRIQITVDEEVFFETSVTKVHPRTAAGVTAAGHLILMVVDGRQPFSRGATLEELAGLMAGVGARDALNLDGGGSTTLVVNGQLVNLPSGATVEREIMSALAVYCDP
jgi:exopolysaccharide biosynthesis protein